LEIFVGESDSPQNVLFDTGSDWLVLEGKDCKNCKDNKYDPNTSSYFQEGGGIEKYLSYGTFMSVTAKRVQDQVCLKSFSLCVEPVSFMLASEQNGINAMLDGILGMAPGFKPRGDKLPSDFKTGPLFLNYLYDAAHITEKSFSTRFTGTAGNNFVDFGPFNVNEMSNKDDLVKIPVNKDFFYSAIP
jgi:hypothetical protein